MLKFVIFDPTLLSMGHFCFLDRFCPLLLKIVIFDSTLLSVGHFSIFGRHFYANLHKFPFSPCLPRYMHYYTWCHISSHPLSEAEYFLFCLLLSSLAPFWPLSLHLCAIICITHLSDVNMYMYIDINVYIHILYFTAVNMFMFIIKCIPIWSVASKQRNFGLMCQHIITSPFPFVTKFRPQCVPKKWHYQKHPLRGWKRDDDDCFYYHSWKNNVVIAFGTLSSFLT